MFRIVTPVPFRLMARKGPLLQSRPISLKSTLEKFKLTPPPPGGVTGNVNEAFRPPEPNYMQGSYHWYYERISAVSIIPLTLVPLYGAVTGASVEYPLIDAALCSLLLVHTQMGLTSCIIDYIPKRKFGIWHNLAMCMLYAGTTVGLYGVYILETENNGLIDLIGRMWREPDTHPIFSMRR
ncbi:AaceriAFR523Cp [[Ashbya] aceris (nom. inval.)]|nr:AaceriAFR523Cp [[Ashbya] aceris (nom. inval.)]